MAVERMDHVGIIVEDLPAAVAFFRALGLEPAGESEVGGDWVGAVIGLEDVRARIAMLRTPDGHSRVELAAFDSPPSPPAGADARAPANALGLRHLTFAVDDLDDALDRLRAHGAELIGDVARYEDIYRLCYVRGPAGVIVELAERID